MADQAHARHRLRPMPPPDYAVPPGETLRDRLDELEMSQVELARRAGLTTKHVNRVVQGVASLSADVAQRLEFVTGVPTPVWLRLEADYRSARSRLEVPELDDDDLAWLHDMPVRQLVRAGALPAAPADPPSRLRQLLRFFGVADVRSYRRVWELPAAAFRQSRAYDVDPGAVAAWLRLGELAGRRVTVADWDPEGLRRWLPELRLLTRREPLRAAIADYCQACARSGVTVVFVPEIAGARAYGATRWLAPHRPLVQLSLRGRTDDQLWETAAHELGHVLMHDRRAVFIDTGEDEPDTAEAAADAREHEATAFARELLIPPAAETRLLGLRRVEDVLGFAAEVGVAVSVAAARLQRHGIWFPRQASRLKRRIEDRDLPDLAAARSAPDDASRRARRANRPHPGQRGD